MMPDPAAAARSVAASARWVALGALSGALAGLAAYAFLESLDHVTEARIDHSWVVWTLPAIGLLVGVVYHYVAGRSRGGTPLVIDEIHRPEPIPEGGGVPGAMAPLIFAGTLASHLGGASVGREGVGIQMSASLTDAAARLMRLRGQDRRTLLIASIAGGFGAIFGVPVAGVVFAMEVQPLRRNRHEALLASAAAAIVGDRMVHGLGRHETARPQIGSGGVGLMPIGDIAKVAVAALAFGVAARLFVHAVHRLKHDVTRRVRWAPLAPVLGGVVTIALMGVVGRDYLGLSTPLMDHALAGGHPGIDVPLLKLLFTVVALSAGFVGGEVTPLFVIGATLGGALDRWLHLPPQVLAACGMVAVFGAAANTPIACTVMAGELFGGSMLLPAAIACVVAFTVSGQHGIYVNRPEPGHRAPRRAAPRPS
jgi:H+/Cl- antiporter ClcA